MYQPGFAVYITLGFTTTPTATLMPIDTTTPQVQAALISLVGVAISVASTLYLARRNIHKDARSRARVEWNTTFRSAISDLIASIDQLLRARIDGKEGSLPERATAVLRAKLQILLLLNESKKHLELELLLNKVSDNTLKPGLYYDPEVDLVKVLEYGREIIAEQWRLASSGK
jgi:hypothetical protein